jgi:serine protease Do
MRKAIFAGGSVLAAIAIGVLVYQTRVAAQDANRFAFQRFDIPLVGPGSSIGITVRDSQAGVVVQEVRDQSPASRAGLRQGDVVTEFDGERTRSAAQFRRLVRETAPGRSVKMAVVRDGKSQTLDVAPESRNPDDIGFPNLAREFDRLQIWPRDFDFDFDFSGEFTGFSQRRLGVTVTPLSDQLASYFGVTRGVLVSDVTPGSAGETAGLKAGDVITAVGGQSVSEPRDVARPLREAQSGTSVEIRVMRDRKEITLTAKIPERQRPVSRRGGRAI